MNEKYHISFVLPMYNESSNIKHSIEQIKLLAEEIADDYEIIVVDDASTDNSADIVRDMTIDDATIKLFEMKKNTKFGGAFAKGFKNATKDIILYMDSDMPVGVEDIKASLPLINDADKVTGYSSIKKGDTLKRKIISGTYNLIVQLLFGLNVKDINSGYKIVKKDMVNDIRFVSHSPFIDVELFLHARKKRYKVRQFALVFNSRTGGKSHISRLPVIWATFVDMIKVKIISLRKDI